MASVEDNKSSWGIDKEVNLTCSDSPYRKHDKVDTRHSQHRRKLHKMTSDKAYQEIRKGIHTDHRNKLRVKHIGFFQITQLESAVGLEENSGYYSIDGNKNPVSSSIEGKNNSLAVMDIPDIGENSRKDTQKQYCRDKGNQPFIPVFIIHIV